MSNNRRAPKKKTNRVYRTRFPRKVSNSGEALTGGFSRGGAMPAFSRAKLTYYDSVQANIASGQTSHQVHEYRVDSLFDPNIEVGGHQPLGRDQWYALYQTARVLSVKIEVTTTFAAGSAAELQNVDAQVNLVYQVRGSGTPSGSEDVQSFFERKQDRIRRVTLSEVGLTVVRDTFVIDPFELIKAVSARFSSRKELGWHSVANPVYESGATPSFFLQLFPPTDEFPTNIEYRSEIRLTYDVQFKDPVELIAS